jgi:hypothetical protein
MPASSQSSSHRAHAIEPEYLGPLSDRPLAEKATSSDPSDLFPGASEFLSGRQSQRRRAQWDAVKPLAAKILQADEHVLYVAHAMQVPPAMHLVAMGAMAMTYHQVVLVITDTRIIELLLGVRGKKAESRVRSFPFTGVRDLTQSLGKMVLKPARGKKQAWRIPLRGDRKLLKLLLPRVKPRLLPGGEAMAQSLPMWHCPQCGAIVPAHPESCASCRATFRSSRMAALLSMAFPGAGLLYAGHPVLAVADFLGEAFLYLIFLLLILEAEPGKAVFAFGFGALFFVLTKLESIHLSHILVARSKPESESSRSRYRKLAMAGGLASLMLIGAAFPLTGAARSVVDRDLAPSGSDSGWQVTHNAAEWTSFADDPSARSQWLHANGAHVTVFAYAQHMLETPSEFREGVRRGFAQQGVTVLKEDDQIPSPFTGFRFLTRAKTSDGRSVATAQYFVVDERNHDIHQAVAAVLDEDPGAAEMIVGDLLSHARWVEASPPVRPAAEAQSAPDGSGH